MADLKLKHYYVRIGGEPRGVTAVSAKRALMESLSMEADTKFEELASKTESGRITVSVVLCDD